MEDIQDNLHELNKSDININLIKTSAIKMINSINNIVEIGTLKKMNPKFKKETERK